MDYLEFKVELAIRLSCQVYHDAHYLVWAHRWLDDSDRSTDAAYAAYDAASADAYDAASADANSAIKSSIKLGALVATRSLGFSELTTFNLGSLLDLIYFHDIRMQVSLG